MTDLIDALRSGNKPPPRDFTLTYEKPFGSKHIEEVKGGDALDQRMLELQADPQCAWLTVVEHVQLYNYGPGSWEPDYLNYSMSMAEGV